jgi:conjugal transfer pilus assembly protein TraW
VIEPDLLAMIRNKLTRLQDGRDRADEPGIRAPQRGAYSPARSGCRIGLPPPRAAGSTIPRSRSTTTCSIPRATRSRAGQRVNPLDFVTVRQSLVFIDADDRDQLEWAMRRYTDLTAKIVMVKGAPLEAMTRWRRGSTSTRAAISPPASASTRFLPSSNPPARSCACPRSVGIGRK